MKSIFEFVRETRDNYRSQTVEITPGYDFSQYQTLRTIELYHNSRFETGNKDTLQREKPFYNITKFRVNVAMRATDLDTKDVHIESDRPGDEAFVQSFLLSLKNRNWMKLSNLGVLLNKIGHTRAKYGHVIVKRVEHDGDLAIHVVPWRDIITDQIDISSGVKIERHYYTPAELKTAAPKGWENIDDAIATAKKSKQADAAVTDQDNKTPGAYIEVYEVHGVLPTCYLAGDEYGEDYGDEDTYERQMHVVVLDESEKSNTKGVTLFKGKEDEDPYKDCAWEEIDGRGLGCGVVEDLFEAQVWTNDGVKKKKDILELAGKIIFQTTDNNVAAKNVLTDLENGSIIKTAKETSLTQVNNMPSSFPALSDLIEEWNTQAENISSTYPALTGETMPSGQPFRLAAMLNREAGSMFEYRRQEAGLFVQEIYRDWVLPFLVKEIKNQKELIASLEGEEIEMVATALAHAASFKFARDKVLSGKVTDEHGNITLPQDVQDVFEKTRQQHLNGGPRRAFEGFDGLFDDWEGSVDVITTGEQENKDATLETLYNLFQTLVKFPQALQDKVLARLFNQIAEKAGMSPLLLGTQSTAGVPVVPPPTPGAAAGAQALPASLTANTTAV